MLRIALELALHDPVYEDVATKFFEHFLLIAGDADAARRGLWDEQDGFFYDALNLPDGSRIPLRARSMVGLIPLYAVTILRQDEMDRLPAFAGACAGSWRIGPTWPSWSRPGAHRAGRHRAAVAAAHPPHDAHALRACSTRTSSCRRTASARSRGRTRRSRIASSWTAPTSSSTTSRRSRTSRLFGGNSNWRGPVWMPVNYLLIESLIRLDSYYGESYRIAFPTGSGTQATLREVAEQISRRLIGLFTRGADGRRPVHGDTALLQDDPAFRDLLLFYEYYDGDTGRGVGASHQTGWSGLVALLIHNLAWHVPPVRAPEGQGTRADSEESGGA